MKFTESEEQGKNTNPFDTRESKTEVETGTKFQPKFDKDGLIACIVTDVTTNEVLMLGYMNATSLKRSIETGEAWYWSRSRQKYWKKGETSGQVQKIVELRTDCDQDAVLIKVRVEGKGATCHLGFRSCFHRQLVNLGEETLDYSLENTEDRRIFDPADVYQDN